MKPRHALALLALMLLPTLPLVGCKSDDGPLEKAGEKLDDAVDGDGPVEKAGEKLDKAVGN